MGATDFAKRIAVGRPLRSDRMGETLLPRWLALPVFCSDPLSSVAYASEAILAILALGGTIKYGATPYVGLAIAALLIIVVLSYRQTIFAYPQGGGAYNVSKDNFGLSAALTAGSALLVDYVMTVTVSVAAGVGAITSAAPGPGKTRGRALDRLRRTPHTGQPARGLKESGKAFAIPTYGFVLIIYAMFAWAAYKLLFTHEAFVGGERQLRDAPPGEDRRPVDTVPDPAGLRQWLYGADRVSRPSATACPLSRSRPPRTRPEPCR